MNVAEGGGELNDVVPDEGFCQQACIITLRITKRDRRLGTYL